MTTKKRTTHEWEEYIGQQIRRARLDINITQNELAQRADISVPTIGRLESGNGSSLETLIKVLTVLELENRIEYFLPEDIITPVSLMQNWSERQRARRPRKKRD